MGTAIYCATFQNYNVFIVIISSPIRTEREYARTYREGRASTSEAASLAQAQSAIKKPSLRVLTRSWLDPVSVIAPYQGVPPHMWIFFILTFTSSRPSLIYTPFQPAGV